MALEKLIIPKETIRKAEKKASREVDLERNIGFQSVTKVHTSKKKYNRKSKQPID